MADPVTLSLKPSLVDPSFRNAVFAACHRAGWSIEHFLFRAAADRLQREGVLFDGVFRPGDLDEARAEEERIAALIAAKQAKKQHQDDFNRRMAEKEEAMRIEAAEAHKRKVAGR